jgi:ABC-2 type transport system ATP-binding protein
MDDKIIKVKGLTKKYGGFTAVKDLNFSIKKGEVFGLLGPNGAGKTTTILMLLGLTEPTAGAIRVLGYNPVRQPLSIKAKTGYIPESVGFYEELTARENLIFIAKLNGLSREEATQRIESSLGRVNLLKVADQPVSTFSRGMRQRLGVADVLIKNPELIIMDEPTQGLDPELARSFLKLIEELADSGITILISSHLLHQAQQVCDRVGLFHQGRMVLEGDVTSLAARIFGGGYRIQIHAESTNGDFTSALEELPGVVSVDFTAPNRYALVANQDLRSEAARAIVEAGGGLISLEINDFNLEDIYNAYFEEVNHGPRK